MRFARKTAQDIASIGLAELSSMNASTLLEKYRLIHYSQEDVALINICLDIIRTVMQRNSNRLEETR